MQTIGLNVREVDGRVITDDTEFPEAFIDHTRLSVPMNLVKTIRLDCNHFENDHLPWWPY